MPRWKKAAKKRKYADTLRDFKHLWAARKGPLDKKGKPKWVREDLEKAWEEIGLYAIATDTSKAVILAEMIIGMAKELEKR